MGEGVPLQPPTESAPGLDWLAPFKFWEARDLNNMISKKMLSISFSDDR